jgi:PKD repeat protein
MKSFLQNALTSLLLLLLFPNIVFCQAPNLGTASSFAVFTSAGAFDNLGASNIIGDIGTNVGAFTGFLPGIVNGQIQVANATSAQAASDLAIAYAQLATTTCGAVISTTLGNNQTLTPNVYCMGAATTLNGDLILDGQGNSNAIFIFQIDGAFSTSTYTNVILINGATACNVFWQVNGAFALGDYSVFRGTLLINGAISLLEGASLYGRALTKAGAVDLHNNIIATVGAGALTCNPITIGIGVDATAAVNAAITAFGSTITWNTGNAITATSYTASISSSCGNSNCTNTITRVQGSISSYIWTDTNDDGFNNEASTAGINGITVELWNATTNTFVASTVTANKAGNAGYCNFNINMDGDYKIKFPTNYLGHNLTTQTTTPATDNNSDANITTGFSPAFTITLSGTGSQVNNATIDAGYLPALTCVKPSSGIDQSICQGTSVILTGIAPTTGTWIAQAGNPTGATLGTTTAGLATLLFTASAVGTYKFIYTVLTCSDTMNIVVKATSTSSSTSTYICNTSLPYTWNGKTYNASATDTVHLTNSVGCDSSAIIILVVQTPNCNLQASYTINQTAQCATGNSFSFTSTVTGNTGLLTYLWNFGDGTTSTLANPTHTYASAGEYDVTLIVTEANACIGSCTAYASTKQVYVGPKPVVNYDWQYNGNCLTYDFNSTSTISMGWITGFYWDFGNGTTSTQSNPLATFNAPGVYNIKLEVTSYYGCKDSITIPVNIINKCNYIPCPVIGAINGTTALCIGFGTTYTDTTAGGTWASTNTGIATISNTGAITTIAVGTTTISYTVVKPCGTIVAYKTITVYANTAQPITGQDSVCVSQNITLSNANSGGTYTASNANVTVNNSGYVLGVTAGNVTITYTIPTPCGVFTSTKVVKVIVCVAPITCNAGWWSQPATSNCDSTLRFNVSNTTTGATYAWSFGDGTTGTGNPTTHKYAAPGNYLVKLVVEKLAPSACKDSVSYNVYVSNCSVTTGGGGGVESKTLGDVIAVRLYGNAVNSKTEVTAYTSSNKFVTSGGIVNGANDLTLSNLVPSNIANTDAAYVSTPTDLVNFTNAVEVLAVDYTKAGSTKAVAFGTKTLRDVYSHTKPICDRLKGAELQEVKNITVNGFNLMAYKVRQRTGETEYAMNLSAGTAANRNSISLQSNWFTDSYQQDEKLYNFQLWAVSYEMVTAMAKDIINKLQANGTVNIVTNADLPKAYISKGARVGTDLTVTIQNNTSNTSGYFTVKEKANEQMNDGQITTRQIPFTLNPNGASNISFPVDDYYEGNIYVYVNNSLTDLVYLADGTWNIDYNQATTSINTFNVVNESPSNLISNNGEYRVFRNVEVNAIIKDYISIYKTMLGGGLEQNLSTYNSLLFSTNTTGVSSIKITLVKKSITNWDDQYSYTIPVSANQEYALDLKSFTSTKFNSFINANDITVINFSFINNRRGTVSMNVNLNNVRYSVVKTNTTVTPVVETPVNLIAVYPNPSTGKFIIGFDAQTVMPLVMKIVNASTGKQVKTQFINTTKGANKVAVSLDNIISSNGLYIVTLEGDNTKYNPAKLIVNKR